MMKTNNKLTIPFGTIAIGVVNLIFGISIGDEIMILLGVVCIMGGIGEIVVTHKRAKKNENK